MSISEQEQFNSYQDLLKENSKILEDFLNSNFPNSTSILGIEQLVEIFSSKKPDQTISLKLANSNSSEMLLPRSNFNSYKIFTQRVDTLTDFKNCHMYLNGTPENESFANFNESFNFCTSRHGPAFGCSAIFLHDSHISTFLRLFKSSNSEFIRFHFVA